MAKRINQSKEQLHKQMQSAARVERMKVVARIIFPLVADQKTIYDAQTAFNAAAGYIKQALQEKTGEILVKDITIQKVKGEKGIKYSVDAIIAILQNEKAEDSYEILERMGNSLGQFSAARYLKNPMSDIKMDDFIA